VDAVDAFVAVGDVAVDSAEFAVVANDVVVDAV